MQYKGIIQYMLLKSLPLVYMLPSISYPKEHNTSLIHSTCYWCYSLTFGDNVGDYNGRLKKQEDVEGEEEEEEGSPVWE